MEKIVQQGILYDFYGELLTDHQKQIYEGLVNENMSLVEIADEQGISRQAVHDLIKRTDKILVDYENRLGLVAKFDQIKELISEIDSRLETLISKQDINNDDITNIRQLCDEIIDLA